LRQQIFPHLLPFRVAMLRAIVRGGTSTRYEPIQRQLHLHFSFRCQGSSVVFIIAWYRHCVNTFLLLGAKFFLELFASSGAAAHVLEWCWHGMGGVPTPAPPPGPPPGHGTLLGASKFCHEKHSLKFLLTPKPLMR